ncbi:hypothetical protein ACCT09_48985, partial [Rhizobium ruizarguesonis]
RDCSHTSRPPNRSDGLSRRGQDVRDRDIEPRLYYPPDVYREPQRNFPKDFRIDVRQVIQRKVRETQVKLTQEQEKLQQIIDKLDD